MGTRSPNESDEDQWDENSKSILSRRRVSIWLGVSLAVAATFWALYRSGPRIPFPGAWYTGEKWPYPSLDELQAYKRTSPSGYILAEWLGIDNSPWLITYYFVASVIAALLIALWVWFELKGFPQRARGFRIAILSPLAGILMVTMGGYDPFTVFGIAFALVAWSFNSRIALFVAGIYMGFQHFEQSIFVVLAWALAVVALKGHLPERWVGRSSPLWILPGVLVGKLCLSILLSFIGTNAAEGRSFWILSSEWLSLAIVGSINFGPILLYSFFAGTWAVVILVLGLPSSVKTRVLLFLAFALPMAIAIITLDHTRVFVMTTIPLVAISIVVVLSSERYSRQRSLMFLTECLAWILVPVSIQGTVTNVDSTNPLDMTIIFVRQILGISPLV